jgi:hypothetical protein
VSFFVATLIDMIMFRAIITCGNDDEYDDAKDHANDAADA